MDRICAKNLWDDFRYHWSKYETEAQFPDVLLTWGGNEYKNSFTLENALILYTVKPIRNRFKKTEMALPERGYTPTKEHG